MSGLGCALLTRDVMEESGFAAKVNVTEDTEFFLDLRRRGIAAFCDTRVKCRHFKFHILDKRNAHLDFSHYKLTFVP
jgi:hypothetical protein